MLIKPICSKFDLSLKWALQRARTVNVQIMSRQLESFVFLFACSMLFRVCMGYAEEKLLQQKRGLETMQSTLQCQVTCAESRCGCVEDWNLNLEASNQWKGPSSKMKGKSFHQPNCSSMLSSNAFFLSKSQAHLDGFFFPGKTCEQSINAHRVPLLYPDSCRLMLHCPDSCSLLPISFLVLLAE